MNTDHPLFETVLQKAIKKTNAIHRHAHLDHDKAVDILWDTNPSHPVHITLSAAFRAAEKQATKRKTQKHHGKKTNRRKAKRTR